MGQRQLLQTGLETLKLRSAVVVMVYFLFAVAMARRFLPAVATERRFLPAAATETRR